jgi:uncharacterized membrane protein
VSRTAWAVPALLTAMVLAYAFGAGTLALRRHWNMESQALDMGYADQITWNTAHGRLLRFTLFRGQVGAELGRPLKFGPGADRDSLLAFHVEPLFVPLSLLYRVGPRVETLLVLLTGAIALGAVPAYLLAWQLLRERLAALAFAAAYLLTPSVQAANLADFHIVSMAPMTLLSALYFLVTGRTRAFVVAAVLSCLLKEEVGLLVAGIGVYAWVVLGKRRLGLAVAAGSLVWVGVCFALIIPHFAGGAPSLFAVRYGDAVRQVRGVPAAWLAGQPTWPLPEYTLTYLGSLLAGTGFLAVLAPLELAISAPAIAINGLSSSSWQNGGGAHYSAEVVPGLLFGAMIATRRLANWASRRLTVSFQSAALVIALVTLGGAAWQAYAHGILPPARRFTAAWAAPNGRLETLRPLLARIPPDARLSVQSNIFPHVSQRERVYVFPAIEDAQFVLVDVAGTSDPLYLDELFSEVNALQRNSHFQLLDGADGFLLFERTPDERPHGGTTITLPDRFYDFARVQGDQRGQYTPASATFEALFEVIGFHAVPVPEVSFGIRHATPSVLVRVLGTTDHAYRITTFRLWQDNLARIHDDGNPTQLWYPTYRWRPGETLTLKYPPLPYNPGERLGLGAQIGIEANVPRLRVTSKTHPVVDGGQVVVLGELP